MVDSRAKGARAESALKDLLREKTGLNWERTPLSGALSANHQMKGDLYVPNATNIFCIEVKHYADDHISSKLITDKTPQFHEWWQQTIREAAQISRIPLLVFKFDRSKWFVSFRSETPPNDKYRAIFLNSTKSWIMRLEDWLECYTPKFIT